MSSERAGQESSCNFGISRGGPYSGAAVRNASAQPVEPSLHGMLHGADSVADGVFTVDEKMRITSFNRAAEEITGFSREEAMGQYCHEIFRSNVCGPSCSLREARATSDPAVHREFEIVGKDRRPIAVSVSTSVLRDSQGNPIGGVEIFRDQTPSPKLRRQVDEEYSFRDLISRSPLMRRLFDVLPDIAASQATVLVSGESGTGKELIVRAIHDLSPRSAGPLVVVDCGALPEPLLEAEIFGTRRGTCPGTVEDRPGRLEMADGGTLFFDEIGDLPLSLQVKLLRVLENPQNKGNKNYNVRFVAATNCDLEAMVKVGSFRRDLFFRINVVSLQVPPLRERPEDIPLLIQLFLGRLNRIYGKRIRGLSPKAMQILQNHDYPGNVRELLNIMEQTIILCRGSEIDVEDLPGAFASACDSGRTPVRGKRKSISAEALHDLLQQHGGNRTEVAEILGVDRTTLWRWMKRHDLS